MNTTDPDQPILDFVETMKAVSLTKAALANDDLKIAQSIDHIVDRTVKGEYDDPQEAANAVALLKAWLVYVLVAFGGAIETLEAMGPAVEAAVVMGLDIDEASLATVRSAAAAAKS